MAKRDPDEDHWERYIDLHPEKEKDPITQPNPSDEGDYWKYLIEKNQDIGDGDVQVETSLSDKHKKEFEEIINGVVVEDALANAKTYDNYRITPLHPIKSIKTISKNIGTAIGNVYAQADRRIMRSGFRTTWCGMKAVGYNLTHNMTKEYFKDKCNINSRSSQKELDNYYKELKNNKLFSRLKKQFYENNQKYRGHKFYIKIAANVISSVLTVANWLVDKVYYKFHNLGKKMRLYAEGKTIKELDPKQFYDSKRDFIKDEMKSVVDYNKLSREGYKKEAEAILKKAKISQKDMLNEISKKDFVNILSKNAYEQYNRAIVIDKVNENMIKNNWSNPEYYFNLSNYDIRLRDLEEMEDSYRKTPETSLATGNYISSEKEKIMSDIVKEVGAFDERKFYNLDRIEVEKEIAKIDAKYPDPRQSISDVDEKYLSTEDVDNHEVINDIDI